MEADTLVLVELQDGRRFRVTIKDIPFEERKGAIEKLWSLKDKGYDVKNVLPLLE